MMEQFRSLKAKHPDALLLFRCGDFYETYMEDAVKAAEMLGIVLTHRNVKGRGAAIEMAGFPYHALENYLPKLVRGGLRVAICDQLEDPRLAKKLVKRGITEIVTPGVALNDGVLQNKENNFVAAICKGRTAYGLALLDISTGEFDVAEGSAEKMEKLLLSFEPKEVLVERNERKRASQRLGSKVAVRGLDDWAWDERGAGEKLKAFFKVATLKGMGVDKLGAGLMAAGAVVCYLEETLHSATTHIRGLRVIDEGDRVRMDDFTIRSLEVFAPMRGEGTSLLKVVDRTQTPMGGRLMRRWLAFPLRDVKEIGRRLDAVEWLVKNADLRESLKKELSGVGDVERLLAKTVTGRVSPRETRQICLALEATARIKALAMGAEADLLGEDAEGLDACENLRERIAKTITDEAPAVARGGGFVRDGVNAEIDELRRLSKDSKGYLARLRDKEAERTGIASLKLGYNNVYGYYLEVRHLYREKVPAEWIRKQTLVGAERYVTEELKTYEERITGAEERVLALEMEVWRELLTFAAGFAAPLQKNARLLAETDCILSHALTAVERNYTRPTVDEGTELEITAGRHPVVETMMPAGERYVPNDLRMDTEERQILVITGPNMAGKSALLRQTALIVLLAQTGSYVPAQRARIGAVDKIFTRVGAADNLSEGESTFMVEMNEAAVIMHSFTQRSLILFDELGRGTSTYDGISLAWAIVEHLHENGKAHPKTLFATHYHELNEMSKNLKRVHNYNVAVREEGDEVIFLRKLVAGGSEHSFGIHVAKMAGMPRSIVRRANEILAQLEAKATGNCLKGKGKEIAESRQGVQLMLFQLDDPVLKEIRDRLAALDVDNLTPMEALNELAEIKKLL